MRNTYFQFKQFKIEQKHASMKVTTEGAIMGAWAGKDQVPHPDTILDIGTGTGILALMMAQRFDQSSIDAVEIDDLSAKDADHNFHSSQWSDRLQLFKCDVKELVSDHTYDLIVINPPFFAGSLKSQHSARNSAIHDDQLPQKELIAVIMKLSAQSGRVEVIYPPFEAKQFEKLAEKKGLYVCRRLMIFDHEESPPLRCISSFSKSVCVEVEEYTLKIKKHKEGAYTDEFTQLLSPFYLHL